jgi:NAD(P)-dependent dehydrogenase (short-subunit alcohol dehydrogenase family)
LIFNNAGISVGALLEEIRLDDVNYVLDVQAMCPVMKRRGFGHIANVTASIADLMATGEGFARYGTSRKRP